MKQGRKYGLGTIVTVAIVTVGVLWLLALGLTMPGVINP